MEMIELPIVSLIAPGPWVALWAARRGPPIRYNPPPAPRRPFFRSPKVPRKP